MCIRSKASTRSNMSEPPPASVHQQKGIAGSRPSDGNEPYHPYQFKGSYGRFPVSVYPSSNDLHYLVIPNPAFQVYFWI
ncbi:hypothetical protein OsI_18250 [Oryza sativa Indica Group]|uniref:Uncharacterized protein n=1 Tax=Oryza sativa subsp. indica TaxID=39946 RepID=A2XZT9_ORYSI|nr:hypothetical protein OsI_18250 [Oryza sativa Indica Group]